MKKKVLILSGYYVPAIKGGGPIQSIKNLVDALGDDLDLYILTSDRDMEDSKPFDGISTDKWIPVGKAKVLYTNKEKLTWNKLKKITESVDFDTLYLNSFFSYKFSILPVLLRKVGLINKRIVLTPRGEFNRGALGLKSNKKRVYITIAKLLNLYQKVNWHGTNNSEKESIEELFGKNSNVTVIKNLTAQYSNLSYSKNVTKKAGELKIAYVGRIHPMKNLKQALKIVKRLNGAVEFNLYGPIEDSEYWNQCIKVINTMPDNIMVNYHGVIDNSQVLEIHRSNHIFLLLTLGENFGHAIAEALTAGNPVVISDRTPWRNLDLKKVGWDLPIENSDLIASKLNEFVELDDEKYREISYNSFQYAKKVLEQHEDISLYLELLS